MARVDDKARVEAAGGPRAAHDVSRLRIAAFILKPLLMLGLLLSLPFLLQAGGVLRLQAWFDRGEVGPPTRGAPALNMAAAYLKATPGAATTGLAAEATQEGHWRFVNQAGEMLTVGTPDEMQRAASLLLPEYKPNAPWTLYTTLETLIERRSAFKDLPKGVLVQVVVGDVALPVLGRHENASEALFLELRSNVVVPATTLAEVRELLWQLSRPIDRAGVRVLALETNGPSTLPPTPRRDAGSGRALVDAIDPGSLAAAMGSVRGQTLIVAGRAERGVLMVKPSSGAERGLLIKDLIAAADSADVNLVILESASTPRQPGGRNWLWQRVEVKGLEQGLARPKFADLLDAVGGSSGRMLVKIKDDGVARTHLELQPAVGVPRGASRRGLGDVLLDAMSDLTGRVVVSAVQASVRTAVRQREIDRRLLPLIPSSVQLGYAALLLVGLVGIAKSRVWWARIWPHESVAEYGNVAGYYAARVIRETLYCLIFLPVAALPAAPLALFEALFMRRRRPANAPVA